MVTWEGKEYLTVAEAMQRKGIVSRQTVYTAVRRGNLEKFTPPGTELILLAPEAVDAWTIQDGPGRPVGARGESEIARKEVYDDPIQDANR